MSDVPFSIRAINTNIKPLDINQATDPSSDELAYFQYYGIDSANFGSPVIHHFGYFDADQYRIAAHIWQPSEKPEGTVFILHGYYDHIGLYRHLISFFLERNFTVVGYDLPGHGLSTGVSASISDFGIYQTVFKQCLEITANLPKPWYMLGQSTGGAIAIDYLLNNCSTSFRKIFLLAPLVRPVHWRKSKMSYFLAKPFIKQLSRNFSENSQDHHFLNFLRHKDPLQARTLPLEWVGSLERWIRRIEASSPVEISPVIIQGQHDHTVDWKHNLPVLQKLFKKPDIMYLPSGRHHLANECEDIRKQYLNYIHSYLPRREDKSEIAS